MTKPMDAMLTTDSDSLHSLFPRDNIARVQKEGPQYRLTICLPVSASCAATIRDDDETFQFRQFIHTQTSDLKELVEQIAQELPFVREVQVFCKGYSISVQCITYTYIDWIYIYIYIVL